MVEKYKKNHKNIISQYLMIQIYIFFLYLYHFISIPADRDSPTLKHTLLPGFVPFFEKRCFGFWTGFLDFFGH